MTWKRVIKAASLVVGALAIAGVSWKGWGLARTIMRWRHLDATYEEGFTPPTELAADLAGRKGAGRHGDRVLKRNLAW